MSNNEWPFSPPETQKWIEKITKELKESAHKINYVNDLEQLSFPITDRPEFSLSSQIKKPNNDWHNTAPIFVSEEVSANKQALNCLNQGADALFFVIQNDSVNWEQLFANIGLSYIQTRIYFQNSTAVESLTNHSLFVKENNLHPEVDATVHTEKRDGLNYVLNGFEWQQCGSSMSDEIAACLTLGNELLAKGIPSENIVFHLGVNPHYFEEIAKFTVCRFAWDNLCDAYHQPNNSKFVARLGWTNKSLKDPYTNLLRQTTEAMSAVCGGIDYLVVHPYDQQTLESSDEFSSRMALNISNLLKDESYLDKVQFPLEGSFVVTNLSKALFEKVWEKFIELEELNSEQKLQKIKSWVSESAEKRKEAFEKGQTPLIGVTIFPNPQAIEPKTITAMNYLGMPYLHFESLNQ